MKPLITTIITTYQRPNFLKRALKSVLNQTYSKFQICIYDNASNDETAAVVREFTEIDKRIKYYCHQENIGMMANYRFAMERIDTPFFTFLSDDDFLFPWFYEEAIEKFDQHPNIALVACGVIAVDQNKQLVINPISRWKKHGFLETKDALEEMLAFKENILIPVGILFSREKTKLIHPNWALEAQLLWDPDYLLRIMCKHPIYIHAKECAVFVTHTQSFSSSFYNSLRASTEQLNFYLLSHLKLLNCIKSDNDTDISTKYLIDKKLKEMVRRELITYIRGYIKIGKPWEALNACFIVSRTYGLNFQYACYMIVSLLCFIPVFRYLLIKIFQNIKKRAAPNLKETAPLEKYEAYFEWIPTTK